MSRLWLLRPVLLFGTIGLVYLFLLKACGGETARTTNYVATIRIDGRDYTSDVVLQRYTTGALSYTGGLSPGYYGRVLTFRLPDDRVVVLSTYPSAERSKCAPRLDRSDTGCKKRWAWDALRSLPDGYVFNNAENPTHVEAFQFAPRSPEFAPDGKYNLGGSANPAANRYIQPIYVSNLEIEIVSFAAQERTRFTSQRDSLDRDFPGDAKLHETLDGDSYRYLNPTLAEIANRAHIPPAKFRR